MKKTLSIIVALLCIASLSVSSFAASGINTAEKQILTLLNEGSKNYTIFAEYRNTAENYFNRDYIEITQTQADKLCGDLNTVYQLLAANSTDKKTIDLDVYSPTIRKEILQSGFDACAAIDLTLTYDQSDEKVTITSSEGNILFEALPDGDSLSGKSTNGSQIKTTGTEYAPMYITFAALAAAFVIIILITKKRGLKKANDIR